MLGSLLQSTFLWNVFCIPMEIARTSKKKRDSDNFLSYLFLNFWRESTKCLRKVPVKFESSTIS